MIPAAAINPAKVPKAVGGAVLEVAGALVGIATMAALIAVAYARYGWAK